MSDRQQAVLEMLLTGATYSAIASTLGVDRKTIYRWRTKHGAFRDQLATRRVELFDAATDRFRSMLSAAMEVLDRQVHDRYGPTALRAARTLLALARVGPAVAAQSAEHRSMQASPNATASTDAPEKKAA